GRGQSPESPASRACRRGRVPRSHRPMGRTPRIGTRSPRRIANMDAYQLAVAIFDQPMVKAIAVLLFGNVLAGIAVALYRRAFYLAALGDWLLSRAIPYVLGDATVQVM